MTWAPTVLQKLVFDTLSADATLLDLLGGQARVYDTVPQGVAYPYVSIKVKPFTARDNQSWRGWTARLQVNVWNNVPSDKSVQDIQKRIDELLHDKEDNLNGWNNLSFRIVSVDILDEPDGKTKHGVQIFNVLLGEA